MKKRNILVKFVWKAKNNYKNLKKSVSNEKTKEINNSFNKQLLNSIHHQFERIKIKFPIGNPIPKKLIPKELKKFGITTLYHSKLTQGWRMLYSIFRGDKKNEVMCVVVFIGDHKAYNKLMGY